MARLGSSSVSFSKVIKPALSFLRFERRELIYILVYTVFVGLASLVSTIAIQILVNQLAFTGQVYPVILLSLLTVFILSFSTIIQLMRRILVELILQRVLIRTSFGAIDALSHAGLDRREWSRRDIVHRFFDVFAYQKAMARILLDGLGVVIVSVIGTTIVLFYHPFLAFFMFFIIAVFSVIVTTFSRRAIRTNYEQSTQKYKMAAWLSSVADSRSLFWNSKTHSFILKHTDHETQEYIKRRRAHFSTLLWQSGSLLILQAVSAGLLLGVGGILVVWGQLDLGQLVAVEVILMAVLAGLVDFGKNLEGVYDLITAAEKLMPLLDSSHFQLNPGLLDAIPLSSDTRISIQSPSAKIQSELKLGDIVAVRGADGEARRQLLWNIAGIENSGDWEISVDETRIHLISQRWRRDHIVLIDRPSVFDVDFRANLNLSLKNMGPVDSDMLQKLPLFDKDFLKAELVTPASEWAVEPRIRLHVALSRAFFTPADIIVIDDLFAELSREQKQSFLEHFRLHCPAKILVVNCDSDLDLPHWTKVIEWT